MAKNQLQVDFETFWGDNPRLSMPEAVVAFNHRQDGEIVRKFCEDAKNRPAHNHQAIGRIDGCPACGE